MTAINALLAFTAWTIVLAIAIVSHRTLLVLAGKSAANEFPAGVEHGAAWYWRMNRAHMNCVENIGLFAAVVLAGVAVGIDSELWHRLAWIAVAARLCQSACHLLSGSPLVVSIRAVFFVTQLACWGTMAFLAATFEPAPPAAAATAEQPAATTSRCTATIRATTRMQAFKGKGEGPTKEAALEAARKAACDTLPQSEQKHCRDPKRYKTSEVVATTVRGDEKSYSATAIVRQHPPEFTAQGTGIDSTAACNSAITAACAKGGAEPDCVANGTYERVEARSDR